MCAIIDSLKNTTKYTCKLSNESMTLSMTTHETQFMERKVHDACAMVEWVYKNMQVVQMELVDKQIDNHFNIHKD